MAIIRCQACGKPNPDFLENCQYCEARLTPVLAAAADETLIRPPANTVRCQACGRSNPDHLENCQYCEARLKPLLAGPPPAVAQTPAAPPADLLARLRSTQTFEAASLEPEGEPPETADAAAWMNRLRDVGSSSTGAQAPGSPPPAEPEPDWMFEPEPEAPLPDETSWQRREPPPPADAPRADSDDALPDWMANLRSSAVVPVPTPAELAPEASETPPADAPPAEPAASAADELPDWLKRDEPKPKPSLAQRPRKKMTDRLNPLNAPPPAAGEPAPAPIEPATPPAEAAAPSLEQPATDAEPGPVQPTDQTLAPASKPRRKKMTDWLTPPEGGLPPQRQSPAPKPTEPEADLPDWLKAMQPAEEVPEWLRDVAAAPRSYTRPPAPPEPPAVEPPAAQAPAAPEPPAPPLAEPPATTPPPAPVWPSSKRGVTGSTGPAGPAVAARAEGPQSAPEADLPAWLKALRGSQPAAPGDPITPEAEPATAKRRQQELPAWLKGATGVLLPAPAAPVSAEPEAIEPAPAEAPAVEAPHAEPPAAAAMPVWLQPAPEPEAPAEAPSARAEGPLGAPDANDAYELPDWLRPSPEALAASEAELAAALDEPVDTAAINAAELASAEEELPDWLRNLPARAAEAEPEGGLERPREPDVPAWLRPSGPPPSPPEPSDDETLTPAATPDWLQNLQAAVPTTPPTPAEASDLPPLDDETLAWLAAARVAEPGEPFPAPTGEPAAAWLDEQSSGGALAALELVEPAAGGVDDSAAEPTPVEEMPDWLKALRGVPTQEQQSAEVMPDWLRALRGIPPKSGTNTTNTTSTPAPAAEPARQPVEEEEHAPDTEDMVDGALPAWLAAMRPTDVEHPADAEADSYEENVGVLAGMRGVLRAEPIVAQPRMSTVPVQRLVVAETHAAQAKLLTGLLAAEEAARPLVQKTSRLGLHLERWLVFTILALAILIPQFVLPDMFGAPETISREAQAAFQAINLAPINQPALVAFDYDPAQQGELSPGAVTIVTHLINRGVPVVAVSTRPLGAAVAQSVLTQVAADLSARAQTSYTYGTQFLNLGYVPGGQVGLLQFAAAPRSVFQADFTGAGPASALWSQPILRGVNGLKDFGVIVLISASPDDTRAWVEQTQNYAAGIPRLAVVSAGAEPMVRPYIEGDAPQLDGLVAGLVGAAQYEKQAGLPGLASRHWSALGGGLWAAVLLIAGGNAVYAAVAVAQQRLGARRGKR